MDLGTKKQQKIRIEASSGLSDAEIQRMRNEAKVNEATDKTEKEKIEKINGADAMIFSTEKQLKEYGESVTAEHKAAIEAALMDLRKSHAEKDIDGIDRATEALNAAWQVASAEMYKNAGANAQGGQQNGENGGGANNNAGGAAYTDVDYEEVKK